MYLWETPGRGSACAGGKKNAARRHGHGRAAVISTAHRTTVHAAPLGEPPVRPSTLLVTFTASTPATSSNSSTLGPRVRCGTSPGLVLSSSKTLGQTPPAAPHLQATRSRRLSSKDDTPAISLPWPGAQASHNLAEYVRRASASHLLCVAPFADTPRRSFLFVSGGWANGLTRPSALTRSVTPTPAHASTPRSLAPPPPNRLSKSPSDSHIRASMASAVAAPLHPVGAMRDDHVVDTRTPSPVSLPDGAAPSDEYQPDLGQEVAMLSTKLVNAINHQTNLDDALQHTRHELEQSKRDNARLRAEKRFLDDMIETGALMQRDEMDRTVQRLRSDLAAETAARDAAEKAKKQTESEVENLTSALFQEANEMVAAARKDAEAAERRNSQLRSKLNDTDVLLASQQEQLQDLKLTMEKMSERGDTDTLAARDSMPSTPVHATTPLFDGLPTSPNATAAAEVPPEHPLHFSQLLLPVMRNDVSAYQDFQDLLQAARKASGHTRSGSSGNTNSGSTLNSASQPNLFSSASPSLPGAFSFSTNSSPQTATGFTSVLPLKDTKFYKRTLLEDIEPTLRLDLAPGLSFLSRRAVLSSLLQGSLVVEPFMQNTKFYGPIYACALCGESRKNEPYVRKYRFRTSEEDSAQRYPLCDYCLGRIRASGDFISFLRMVRDGHWRAESDDEQKGAWEESVRLRERMFWARLGGGVVPALALRNATPSNAAIKSARPSLESIPEVRRKADTPIEDVRDASAGLVEDGEEQCVDLKLIDVFKRQRDSLSVDHAMPDLTINSEAQPAIPGTDSEDPGPAAPSDLDEPSFATPTAPSPAAEDEETPSPTTSYHPEPPATTNNLDNPHSHTLIPPEAPVEPAEPAEPADPTDPSSTAGASASPLPTPTEQTDIPILQSPDPSSPMQQRRSPDPKADRFSPERTNSGVLARVRAIQAAQDQTDADAAPKRPPGSFD